MRDGVPVLTVPQQSEALDELYSRAKERGTTVTVVRPIHLGGATLPGRGETGWHATNASLARQLSMRFLDSLGALVGKETMEIESATETGIGAASLPGRFEIRTVGSVQWFIDGAHTLESVRMTAKWFASSTKQERPGRVRVFVFNQECRDTSAMLSALYTEFRGKGESGTVELPFYALFCSNAPFVAGELDVECQSMASKRKDCVVGDTLQIVQEKNMQIWRDMATESTGISLTFQTIQETVAYVNKLAVEFEGVSCLATVSFFSVVVWNLYCWISCLPNARQIWTATTSRSIPRGSRQSRSRYLWTCMSRFAGDIFFNLFYLFYLFSVIFFLFSLTRTYFGQ